MENFQKSNTPKFTSSHEVQAGNNIEVIRGGDGHRRSETYALPEWLRLLRSVPGYLAVNEQPKQVNVRGG